MIFTHYRPLQFKFVGHSRWTHDSYSNFVFCLHFRQSFTQNRRTALVIVNSCTGHKFESRLKKHRWKLVAQNKIELYNMQRIFSWDKFDWNATILNEQILKLVDQWTRKPIIMIVHTAWFIGSSWLYAGADPGVFTGGWGEGGKKDYVRERTLRARNPESPSAGVHQGCMAQWI